MTLLTRFKIREGFQPLDLYDYLGTAVVAWNNLDSSSKIAVLNFTIPKLKRDQTVRNYVLEGESADKLLHLNMHLAETVAIEEPDGRILFRTAGIVDLSLTSDETLELLERLVGKFAVVHLSAKYH